MSRKRVRSCNPSLSRAEAILRSRAEFRPQGEWFAEPTEAEGGCGVTGFACTIPVGGKHIYEPSIQMRNRGNGKGGGIAACGLVAEDLGVSSKVLKEDYILQVALLDPKARGEIEKKYVEPFFDVDHGGLIPTVDDYRDVPLLEVRPPDVVRYFVRPKAKVLDEFGSKLLALSSKPDNRQNGLSGSKPKAHSLKLSEQDLADEFISQNSVALNREYYASLGDKRAFVLSHARNLIILKIVGFAEASVQYYRLADTRAHVWIAHQRYPTKGRVWHPGGAHPFIGMNEALVHNGDFANYHSVCEYLAQRNIFPQFLTDTEVSVQLFDLWNRVYRYPLEYIIEALAPTTEFDFDKLPLDKQRIYRQIQATHMHGSPDGPWFFIIARSLAETGEFQLIGITDTAMLRPQVFALQEGDVSIGLICSEKQAIDATLASLAGEDDRFTPIADSYWNARGGSHTDGGAFVLTVSPEGETASHETASREKRESLQTHEPFPRFLTSHFSRAEGPVSLPRYTMAIADKFGKPVKIRGDQVHCKLSTPVVAPSAATQQDVKLIEQAISPEGETASHETASREKRESPQTHEPVPRFLTSNFSRAEGPVSLHARLLFEHLRDSLAGWDYNQLRWFVSQIAERTAHQAPGLGIEAFTLALDRRYPTWDKKRSSVLTIVRSGLEQVFQAQPLLEGASGEWRVASGETEGTSSREKRESPQTHEPVPRFLTSNFSRAEGPVSLPVTYRRITWQTRDTLRGPAGAETTLLIDARGFSPEGEDCDARLAVRAYHLGWRHLVHYNSRGTRFHASGFGPATDGLRVDCYDNPGDYLASGIDGLEAHVHGNAQDQLGQITKRGKLVIHGDVGQTFLYGAKGGEFYIMGNAAGRPMINAVGSPRVVINGTALDFLAESFMAGNPHAGGGFAIVNGIRFNEDGHVVGLESPYPGSNLLSLASGGAIYVRDPHRTLSPEQLNGGVYRRLTNADWKLILPYLQENERLFDIQVERDLLSVDEILRDPRDVYRKVVPAKDAEAETEMEGLGA